MNSTCFLSNQAWLEENLRATKARDGRARDDTLSQHTTDNAGLNGRAASPRVVVTEWCACGSAHDLSSLARSRVQSRARAAHSPLPNHVSHIAEPRVRIPPSTRAFHRERRAPPNALPPTASAPCVPAHLRLPTRRPTSRGSVHSTGVHSAGVHSAGAHATPPRARVRAAR